MIEVQHLTKRYGPVTAVDDVSFKAERGEILGFLGPNGAGKTTTMRVLTGYMPATDGKAIVAGYDVLEQPVEAKRRTGYLPETPPLYPDMTVEDYLAFCARIKGVPRSERTSRLQSVMEKTQIADMRNRHCGKALERVQAARWPRSGAAAQPGCADPRRADRRPRPEAAESKHVGSSRDSAATTRSSSARTSFPRSARPAIASSSSTAAKS